MSTYTAIHIKQCTTSELLHALNEFPEIQNFEAPSISKEYPEEIRESFIIGTGNESPFPTIFAVENSESDFISIYYNSSCKLELLAERLSSCFGLVAVTQFQSVSGAYYIAVYRKGKIERAIYIAEGEEIENLGSPYDFEDDILGRDISESDEEPIYSFGWEDAGDFCRNIGFDLEKNQPTEFYILKRKENKRSITHIPEPNKPWWKIW